MHFQSCPEPLTIKMDLTDGFVKFWWCFLISYFYHFHKIVSVSYTGKKKRISQHKLLFCKGYSKHVNA